MNSDFHRLPVAPRRPNKRAKDELVFSNDGRSHRAEQWQASSPDRVQTDPRVTFRTAGPSGSNLGLPVAAPPVESINEQRRNGGDPLSHPPAPSTLGTDFCPRRSGCFLLMTPALHVGHR
jgi:hypothetical protein